MSDRVPLCTRRHRAGALLGSVAVLIQPGCGAPDGVNEADAARHSKITTHDGTGTSASQCGCADEQSNEAAPPHHVDPGTTLTYGGLPPVSGVHWRRWPVISQTLYLVRQRPELGELVHSEEHGWTIVWYDETIVADDSSMQALFDTAREVDEADATKLVLMPWTRADGGALPDGAHIALTHWGKEDDGTEWRQFCASASSRAVFAYSDRHPSTDAREPNGP